jgi:hypothetical protein
MSGILTRYSLIKERSFWSGPSYHLCFIFMNMNIDNDDLGLKAKIIEVHSFLMNQTKNH